MRSGRIDASAVCVKPRLLDVFSGAGGAARGYQRAGFYVVGVDHKPQPRYAGDEFIQADALEFLAAHGTEYDAIHASPPCQRYMTGGTHRKDHPDLVGPVREKLLAIGLPWVIENVPGAPLRRDLLLCGSMFGLPLRRHRIFERSVGRSEQPPCRHNGKIVGVYGNPHGARGAWPSMRPSTPETWSEALGIDWMTPKELSQAIPPAYTEFIGKQLIAQLEAPCTRES